jgi:uncharacterized RDD family membrane protein YckC
MTTKKSSLSSWKELLDSSVDTIIDHKSTEFQYAGFAIRLKAFALDYLIILVYIVVLFGVNFGIILAGGGLEEVSLLFASLITKDAIAFLTLILPVILYFSLQESSDHQGTWGKRKVGLRMVTTEGETLTRWRAFVRSLIKFLPWQIAHTSLYHWEGWPFAPVDPPPMVIVGFGLTYILVGIYIAAALISK